DPPSSKKARHKVILALVVAYLWGQTAILHSWEWPRINGKVQLMVPPSVRHGHYCSCRTTCPRVLLWYENLNESPLQLLEAQQAQARPTESNMRILNFGLRLQKQHKYLGYEKEHHPLCRRSRLLHLTRGQLRPIPTMGETSHLYKGEKESLTDLT
ncbi:hypothetical protein HID58_079896, partial [Brassica napus]